jgi:nicotinate-nucleotide adenylyltransferase
MTSVLGILGGTFDPIHYGHLELAREAMAAAGLAAVRLIPAGDPPHRRAPVAGAIHRLAMAKIAVADYRGLAVDAREINRAGRSYTVLTLQELRSEIGSEPLALVVGADAFLDLPTWHHWRELFVLAHIIVVARPGTACDGQWPSELAAEWERRHRATPDALRAAPAGAIVRVAITPRPISASAIRTALAAGDEAAVRGLLPPAVLAYIERNRLYRPGQDAT